MTSNRHHVRTPFAPPDPLPPHLKYALPIMLRSHHSASLIPSLRSKSVHIAPPTNYHLFGRLFDPDPPRETTSNVLASLRSKGYNLVMVSGERGDSTCGWADGGNWRGGCEGGRGT